MKKKSAAFSLVELMISMTILIVLMILFTKIIDQTSVTIQSADKQIDISMQLQGAMNRLNADLSGIVTQGGATLLVLKDLQTEGGGGLNDALVFATRIRTRQIAGSEESNARLAVRTYKINPLPDAELEGNTVPMLALGDETMMWTKQQGNNSFATALRSALDKALDQSNEASEQFKPLTSGIFRMEVSFLLNDGTTVSIPPRHRDFTKIERSNVYAAAFNAEDSLDPKKTYVQALVLSFICLDRETRKQVGSQGSEMGNLSDLFVNPERDQFPLQAWDIHKNRLFLEELKKESYGPKVLKSMKILQRYFYLP